MVSPGSSSIHGMAHFGRPWTLAKPGSTGVLPTVRLMQLIGICFGKNWSNRAGLCGGPSTQPHVASVNGGLRSASPPPARPENRPSWRRSAAARPLPRPTFGRPQPVVVQGMNLGDPPEHSLVDVCDNGRVGWVLARRLQTLFDRRGHDQRRLGADAGLDAQPVGEGERVAQQRRPSARTGRCTARATSCCHGIVPRMYLAP